MQDRCEETFSIPKGAEGTLIAEVAAMELSEDREVDVKQWKEEEEMQSCWKERMHHRHGHYLRHHHHYGHLLHPHHHGHHLHPHHHGHHPHPHHHGHHPHPHHKEKKWEKLQKMRMNVCCEKEGSAGWNSKSVGKLKHKLEKIDWKIESSQEKKLFILRRIQEIQEEEEKKNEAPLPTVAA